MEYLGSLFSPGGDVDDVLPTILSNGTKLDLGIAGRKIRVKSLKSIITISIGRIKGPAAASHLSHPPMKTPKTSTDRLSWYITPPPPQVASA